MPPLIRRRPLSERINDLLNPADFLLWLSEELHESAWDEALQDWALPIGAGANILFIIARANSGAGGSGRRDDVFGDFDGRGGSGWFGWFASFTAHLLALLSFLNALYTFTRNRHYRLFESSIDQAPSTPSARRVRVDSSPASSSPLRFVSSFLAPASAESRAHPNQQRDVWEIKVWDPKELNLELFTFFSPGHVLIYWLFFPTSSIDPRPSVTLVTAIVLGALLSVQMVGLRKFFTQQAKDSKIINKEVLHEYDTKFVHPSLNKPVRDVGVQTKESSTSARSTTREVDVYTPTTIINRGFSINPNPSYSPHLGEDSDVMADSPSLKRLPRSGTAPQIRTPLSRGFSGCASVGTQPERSQDAPTPVRSSQPQRMQSPMKGDGGSLGVYSHAASPLKKAASSGHLRPGSRGEGSYSSGRIGSPLKRMSTPNEAAGTSRLGGGGGGGDHLTQRFGNLRDGNRRQTGL